MDVLSEPNYPIAIVKTSDRLAVRGFHSPVVESVAQRVPSRPGDRLGCTTPPGAVPPRCGDRRGVVVKVWIDQDLCTGDGLCEEIAPDVFVLLDDGLAYVREGDRIFAASEGNPEGAEGLAKIPEGQLDLVVESAEECPGECIFIEP